MRGYAIHPIVNYTELQNQRVGCMRYVRYARTRLLD